MADFVSELLAMLDRTPRERWESTLRTAYGGQRRYVSLCTGRGVVEQLVAAGIPRRTATFKARGR